MVEQQRTSERGFSLIDVCVTLVISVILLYALHSGTHTAMKTRRTVESEYQVHLYAREFITRLRQLPHGRPGAATPTAEQLEELFDDDHDFGSVTLLQLVCDPEQDGHSFTMASQETQGVWRVRIVDDLNADGDRSDDREGRADLLRIEVHYNDRIVLESLQAATPTLTVADTTADYVKDLPKPPKKTTGSTSDN